MLYLRVLVATNLGESLAFCFNGVATLPSAIQIHRIQQTDKLLYIESQIYKHKDADILYQNQSISGKEIALELRDGATNFLKDI